jgi:hypothetical protein
MDAEMGQSSFNCSVGRRCAREKSVLLPEKKVCPKMFQFEILTDCSLKLQSWTLIKRMRLLGLGEW